MSVVQALQKVLDPLPDTPNNDDSNDLENVEYSNLHTKYSLAVKQAA